MTKNPSIEATQNLNVESTISQVQILGERIKSSQKKTLKYIKSMGDVLLKSARYEYENYPNDNKDECLKHASHQLYSIINKCSKKTTLSRNLLRASFWQSSKQDAGHEFYVTSRREMEDLHKQANYAMPLYFNDQSSDLQRFRLESLPNIKRDSNQVYILNLGNAFKIGVTCDGSQRFDQLKKDLKLRYLEPVLLKQYANARNVETMALNFLRSQALSLVSTKKEIFIKYPPAYKFVQNLLNGSIQNEEYKYLDVEYVKAKDQLYKVLAKSNMKLDFQRYRNTTLKDWCGEVVSMCHYFYDHMYAFKDKDFNICTLLSDYENIGLSEYDLVVRSKILNNIQLQKDLGNFNEI
tara:strand:+ start:35 stop:1090 length:1056 start_codon:yes stop_codon:yes gene_type:complete